jgi:transcription termination/antitermination protein NusG
MNVAPLNEKTSATMLLHPLVFDRVGDQWFILHTLSNQEKLLASAMQAMDVAYFLPLRRIERVQGRLRSQVMIPLFPSYLFIRGSLDEVYRADRTKRVASVVRVYDQQRLESEIRSIHMALLNDGAMTPHPYLQKGISVEVRSGPFRGMRGLISDSAKDNRLILQVDVLGQATALEIDGSLLEPI